MVSWRVGRLSGKALMLLILTILFIFLIYRGVHVIRNKVTSIDICTGDFSYKIRLTDQRAVSDIYKNIMASDVSTAGGKAAGKYRVILSRDSGQQVFWFDSPGRLYEVGTGKVFRLKDNGALLAQYLKRIKDQNPYGEFLTWEQARIIFKKYDTAKVIDIETRLAFMVQRRAGSRHADVQPLTAKDSDIMKKIYAGRWSWKRRAVIVETGDRRIAGSMNGMPHGAGAIRGNKFNGHFCIHFRDSKLHSGGTDKAHQLMVWKAAGAVDQMVSHLQPEDVVRMMMTAMEQGDYKLATRFVRTSPEISETVVTGKLKEIEWIAASSVKSDNRKKDRIAVKVSYKLTDGVQYKNRTINIKVIRPPGQSVWKLEPDGVLELLTKDNLNKSENEKNNSTLKEPKVDLEM